MYCTSMGVGWTSPSDKYLQNGLRMLQKYLFYRFESKKMYTSMQNDRVRHSGVITEQENIEKSSKFLKIHGFSPQTLGYPSKSLAGFRRAGLSPKSLIPKGFRIQTIGNHFPATKKSPGITKPY